MTKKVIAIISVLKPVDDSRNFEKIAATIGNTSKYEINIIGFFTKKIPVAGNTNFHPIFNFDRLSTKRLVAPIKALKLLLKLKPDMIIVTCAELLIVSLLMKMLTRTKIVYDVQENYLLNIIYSGSYPWVFKYPIAAYVRTVEYISSKFIDLTIFAEKIYADQLQFLSSNSAVFENKASISEEILKMETETNSDINLIYCGTIAEHYGVFDAIELTQRLQKDIDHVHLKIVGYAAISSVRRKLIEETKDLKYVHVSATDQLIPHEQILMEMKKSSFCILPYKNNKSTEGRIPTKLFECLSLEMPVIINSNESWNSMINENNAGITYDFEAKKNFPIKAFNEKYYGHNRSHIYKWENSATSFIELIEETLE